MTSTSASARRELAWGILILECVLLVAAALIFWFPVGGSFIDRGDWLWLPLALLPLEAARLMLTGTRPVLLPLLGLFAVFLALGALNTVYAPYTSGLATLARPFLGMCIVYIMIEVSRASGRMTYVLAAAVLLALVVGLSAMLLTQWNEKSAMLGFIIDALPSLRLPPDTQGTVNQTIRGIFGGGYNANEVAGALSWLTPLMAGLAIYGWREKQRRAGATLAFLLLFSALMLGQSRTAIFGVLPALGLNIALLIPRGRWRRLAWVALALVTVFELVLIFNPAERDRLETRDENSFAARLEMWRGGLDILRDYPLTGVGMNMYRIRAVRERYPAPLYGDDTRVLPHIHNEPLQAAVDLGVPGLIVFLGLYAAAAYMLYYIWKHGEALACAVSVAVGAGLLAHIVFGMADAVTLWDRFATVFWLMIGLAAAQYALIRTRRNA